MVTDNFLDEYDPTIEDSYRKSVDMYGTKVLLDILDTAGPDEFNFGGDRYAWLRDLVVLVYSITSRDSFDSAKIEREKMVRFKDDYAGFFIILVGNKIDLKDQRQVSYDEGYEYAKECGIPFIESSAKTRENIDQIFEVLLMTKFGIFKALEEDDLAHTQCNCILL